MIPGATEVPDVRVLHMETPSPHTRFGIKGMGEGGAIAPPAAIVNAINDALKPLGAEIGQTPATPDRILRAIIAAREGGRGRGHEAGALHLSPCDLDRRRHRAPEAGAIVRPLAGGQSLVPMLNLRLAPADSWSISRIDALRSDRRAAEASATAPWSPTRRSKTAGSPMPATG